MQGSGEKIFVHSASDETKGVGMTWRDRRTWRLRILVHSENVKALGELPPRRRD